LELRKELTFAGDREKKAASAPETNADMTNRITIAVRANNKFNVSGFMEKSGTELIMW